MTGLPNRRLVVLKRVLLSLAPAVPLASRLLGVRERGRRSNTLMHGVGRRRPAVASVVVADKRVTDHDVAIGSRLLLAYHRARPGDSKGRDGERTDLWTDIQRQQSQFIATLMRNDPEELATYLCNLSRHDAGLGIVQGSREYDRIVRDRSYRDFIALMTKDKLVSLAEAVGVLPVENPEQGSFGISLHRDPDALVAVISGRLGLDISPPDVDGGLLKLQTSRGLFGERDLNAIFTAFLLARVLGQKQTHRICEIGGGTGRVAYWSTRFGLGSYAIIDLPHVNVVQGYYLLKCLKGDRVVLYGEPWTETADGVVRVLPTHAIHESQGEPYDLVLNQDSFPEMNPTTVREYLEWIGRVCTGRLLSINHESKPPYGDALPHRSVPEIIEELGGYERLDRFPYWLRKGYVAELYRVGVQARDFRMPG
jgi:hypothetical protein